MTSYVHGYHAREHQRLDDQADALADRLHNDTDFAIGARVLELGCGVGSQTTRGDCHISSKPGRSGHIAAEIAKLAWQRRSFPDGDHRFTGACL